MNLPDYLRAQARAMSEDELQSLISGPKSGMALQLGYLCYHTRDSRRSNPGFPDLCMVGNKRLIFAELKSETGKVTLEQQDWLNRLDVIERKTKGVVVARLWRPSDWLDGTIEEALR